MDSKMKLVRFVLRDLLIIICLFIPCIVIWLSNAVISLVRKVSVYVQSEWERFSDIYFGNTAVGKDVDPAFLAYMRGEDSVTGPCRFYHTAGARNKVRQYFLVFVNSVADALLLLPEKIYAYVQGVSEDYHNNYRDSRVELPYTAPASIAYLKGEERAPFLRNPREAFSKSDLRDMKNFAANSDIESRSQRQRQNGKVTEGLSLVRFVYKLYCGIRSTVSALFFRFHRSTFRGQVIGRKHFETSQEIKQPYFNERKAQNFDKATNLYHPRQAHLGTVPSLPAFAVGSDHGHDLFKCLGALRKAWICPVNFRVPPNTSPKLWSSSLHSEAGRKQWNTSPAVVKRTEKQFKLFSEGKANRDVKHPSTLRSKADSAGSESVGYSQTEKKVKERETPFLFSVANVDTPAPTLPVREKGKGKVMPGLILTSRVPVLPRVEPPDEEKVTSVVCSNQAGSANVCADSEPVPTQHHGRSSVEEPRVKQAENKECSKGKPRKNPLSEDAPLLQAKTVRFCTDSKAVANQNNVTSSLDEKANREPKVSRVKRPKITHRCLEDKSNKNSSLGDLNSSHFSSADVSTDSHNISSHSHVTNPAEEQIEVKPEGSRVKRTMNWKESANVCGDSQVSELGQIVEEPLVARIKRTRNEEDCKQPGSWDAQTCLNSTKDPSNMTPERSTGHVKRKAESGSDAISMSKKTGFLSS